MGYVLQGPLAIETCTCALLRTTFMHHRHVITGVLCKGTALRGRYPEWSIKQHA